MAWFASRQSIANQLIISAGDFSGSGGFAGGGGAGAGGGGFGTGGGGGVGVGVGVGAGVGAGGAGVGCCWQPPTTADRMYRIMMPIMVAFLICATSFSICLISLS